MIIRTFAALIVAGLALPAVATEFARPTLRAEVSVSDAVVRLADLIDNLPAGADAPVFRAPDFGYTGTVQIARVVEAARSRGVTQFDAQGLAEVAVSRTSRAVTPEDMQSVIALAIERQNGFDAGSSLVFSFDAGIRTAHIEPALTAPLQVTRIDWNPRSGRFEATLNVEGSSVLASAPLRVTGTAVESVEVNVYARPLGRGEVLRAADITTERRPRALTLGDTGADPTLAIGQAVRRPVRAGQVVATSDLTKPEIVARNDNVTIVFEVPGMILTVRGKANEAGAEGDTISVLNIQSKRIVQATITGPGRVSVLNHARLALN